MSKNDSFALAVMLAIVVSVRCCDRAVDTVKFAVQTEEVFLIVGKTHRELEKVKWIGGKPYLPDGGSGSWIRLSPKGKCSPDHYSWEPASEWARRYFDSEGD